MKNGHVMHAALVASMALSLQPAATARTDTPFTIYDSLTATDGVAFIGDLVIDDLTVAGGGLLQTVTIALTAEGGGGSVTTDVMLSLAIDGGDGFPDLDGTGDDRFLFQTGMFDVSVPVGGVAELSFDVANLFPLVPDGALLFGGVQLTNPSVGHLFYAAPIVGSTNDIVFSFGAGGPTPVPGVSDPDLTSSLALAFRLEAVALPDAATRSGIVGTTITFDGFDEGFQGTAFTTGGVTFSEGRDGFAPPVDGMFALDDGTGVWEDNPDMLAFVGGTLLGLNGFSGGPDGYTFAILKSLRMTPDRVRTGARLSVAYVVETLSPPAEDYSNGTITLLAMREGKLVASESTASDNTLGMSSGGSFTFGASELEISGVAFDDLVLFTTGAGPGGSLLMTIDNVLVGDATCSGDLDADGLVGFADLLSLLAAWGPCPPDQPCRADLDSDGMVGFADLLSLLAAWGPCEP